MMSGVDRTAILDMGSNSFRLVVFEHHRGGWWRLAWFVVLWRGGLLAVGAVALLIRLWLQP